ncbi:hypothetical protein LVY74_00340 [Acinetobacter sp. ME22]|uniref:hypothetical protein n=1 Tax=Acinetobacter sp. ME22 TaxID=2904802 RepID=UPI001EDC003F|nr:hypothetical protein [Acinetobacter sp. ME22]MCG2572007.1 hypothetical protein [Acinetobacter sp. ME22]
MSNEELRKLVYESLPAIDSVLDEQGVPIFDRAFHAAIMFVEYCVEDNSIGSKEELIKHKVFIEGFIPLFYEWYTDKYGDFIKKPQNKFYSGLIVIYGIPSLIQIPATISKIHIVNESSWLKFPDSLQKDETLEQMMKDKKNINKLSKEHYQKVFLNFEEIVSLTRKINLNILTATLDSNARNMASSIWPHIEKCIQDICTFNDSSASVGCWELHLAVEKTLKVFLMQHHDKKMKGHDLLKLANKINEYNYCIDLDLVEALPSSSCAIEFRYGEKIINFIHVYDYYIKTLILIEHITSKYKRKYLIYNAAFLIKAAPWLKLNK